MYALIIITSFVVNGPGTVSTPVQIGEFATETDCKKAVGGAEHMGLNGSGQPRTHYVCIRRQ